VGVSNLVVFNGGLMRGQSAHWKLRGATFLEEVRTAPRYRLFSIGDRYPAMLRDEADGVSITAELYLVPDDVWARVDNIEPPGLYRGPIELSDGRVIDGMLGEPRFTRRNGVDISGYGSWADYPNRTGTARMDKDPDDLAFELMVFGAHMRGMPRHAAMGGAPYLGVCRTEARYRIHTVNDAHPGLYRLAEDEVGGVSVEGELYRVSRRLWPEVEASLPAGMYHARVTLEDLSEVEGLLFPRELSVIHLDISQYGGWRAYMCARKE
jgi:gamma-glutamylcyclotransferase (GGCT)/AIG2-like uncharacterized protein YtfP